jgi:putative transposase
MKNLFNNKYRIPSNRAQWWDYRRNAVYLITLCTRDRKKFFGEIADNVVHLSETGKVAQSCWENIPDHFPFVTLDEFMVMPNHIHGIIVIDNPFIYNEIPPETKSIDTARAETLHAMSLPVKNEKMASISPKRGSLSSVIRSFKSAVSKYTGINGINDFAWQPNYYDHIIHNFEEYKRIADYIRNNPLKWKDEKLFNP